MTVVSDDPQGDQELDAQNAIVRALKSLPEELRSRVIESACIFVGVDPPRRTTGITVQTSPAQLGATYRPNPRDNHVGFGERVSLSPKEFLHSKEPQTDVERIACLAYFVKHYRDTPHFKNIDLSELNTEAAQPKISNVSQAVANAVRAGFLVPAPSGQRQLSSMGEQFILALPDREAARIAIERMQRRRLKSAAKKKQLQ